MNCLQHTTLIWTLLIISSLVGKGHAQDDDLPDRIDVANFPGEVVRNIVVPIPAEIFAVLDKVGENDWEGEIIHVKSEVGLKDRGFLAMSFGSLVAEGFIAVQAESSDDIQKIGLRSLVLAEALSLEEAVKKHSLTIVDSAKANSWNAVRTELDRTQQTVRDTMNRQRDQDIAGLVSLGGWLRGTNVLTKLILRNYTPDKAELLNQPGLVKHFRELIADFKSQTLKDQMQEIDLGLGRIEPLMKENKELSFDEVQSLYDITQEMLQQFYFDSAAETE